MRKLFGVMKTMARYALLVALGLCGPVLAQGGLDFSDDFSRYPAGSGGAPVSGAADLCQEIQFALLL